jgi:hypothetical protein
MYEEELVREEYGTVLRQLVFAIQDNPRTFISQ